MPISFGNDRRDADAPCGLNGPNPCSLKDLSKDGIKKGQQNKRLLTLVYFIFRGGSTTTTGLHLSMLI